MPAVLAPFSLYPAWTWTLRRDGRALELALSVLGLYLGIGLISVLEVLFYASDTALTLADAAPGALFSGAIYVLPAAFLAAAALWVGTHAHGRALSLAIVAAVPLAAFLAIFLGAGLGIIAGGAVALARRVPTRVVAIGTISFVVTLIAGILPLVAPLTG